MRAGLTTREALETAAGRRGGGHAVQPGSLLDQIVACKLAEIELLRAREDEIARALPNALVMPCRDLECSLRSAAGTAIIAEIKRVSPLAGRLARVSDPGERARRYHAGGAAAVSVLTDAHYFDGCLEDLREARSRVPLPVMRKDFLLDPLQVMEARIAGADAVLLIAALLEDEQMRDLFALCGDLGMGCLMEVHDELELERVLSLSAPIIGINNRNLVTMEVDTGTTERLAPMVPSTSLTVSESGVEDPAVLERLSRCGADAFLIGTPLMTRRDPAQLLRELGAAPRRG